VLSSDPLEIKRVITYIRCQIHKGDMQLQIFDVEHGACALLTADNGTRLMIDCGHNASTGWKPGTYLRQRGITHLDMLAVTNYDEDHVSGANNLFDNIDVKWLWRNPSVSAAQIQTLKSEDGMGQGIERLVREIQGTFSGPPSPVSSLGPDFNGLTERMGYHNSFPLFDDENNLSLAVFMKCHGIGVMFTGDLESKGFKQLIVDNPVFRHALGETRIFVAPHHGREGGCCEEALPFLPNVNYVVISDKGYMHDTQETIPFYHRMANGGPYGGQTRYVLTTRCDGEIVFNFNTLGWGPGR
jgi:beta-lactamase superfamily II metal-dependent hydrolase